MTKITLEFLEQLMPEIRSLAIEAGAETLKYFAKDTTKIKQKTDGSPVTLADEEAEKIIIAGLKKLTPNIQIVAEESTAAGKIPTKLEGQFWLVDPLDGTKEFISGSGEYTVNIALIDKGEPIMGVIYLPVKDEIFTGIVGKGANHGKKGHIEEIINIREQPKDGITIIGSRSHGSGEKLDNFLKNYNVKNHISRGSSLKFCEVARGNADIYPRFGPTCEWDIAAGHAILRAAGGEIKQINGKPMIYGKILQKFLNPEFIAYGIIS